MITCPECNAATSVMETRDVSNGTVRRRRRCDSLVCNKRFSTVEFIVPEGPMGDVAVVPMRALKKTYELITTMMGPTPPTTGKGS